MEKTKQAKSKTLYIVQLAIFTAIEAIFCFTPLGSLPLGPGIVATLAHIPALIAAFTLGKLAALYMGGVMGIFALIVWTFMPSNPLYAFCFTPFAPYGSIWSLVICIVPRMIFPVVAAVIFEALKNFMKRKKDNAPKTAFVIPAVVAAVVGSVLHSVMVLGGIYLCFGGNTEIIQGITEQAGEAAAVGVSSDFVVFLIAWGWLNSVFEAIIAGILSGALILPLRRAARAVERG